MRPEDVPDELIKLLRNGIHIPRSGSSAEDWARCILANTLPEYEQAVRVKVSAEILAAKDNLPPGLPINAVMPLFKGIDIAAAIALNGPTHPEKETQP